MKNCPFCGGPPRLWITNLAIVMQGRMYNISLEEVLADGLDFECYIYCANCDARGPTEFDVFYKSPTLPEIEEMKIAATEGWEARASAS